MFVAAFPSRSDVAVWSRSFTAAGDPDSARATGNAVAVAPNGVAWVGGSAIGAIDVGLGEMVSGGLLAGFDSSGTVVAAAENTAQPLDVSVDGGQLTLSGSFGGTVDFGGGNLSSTAGSTGFVAVFELSP